MSVPSVAIVCQVRSIRLSTITEETLNHTPALLFADARDDIHLVVEPGILSELIEASGGSPFGIGGAENHGFDPGVHNCAHTHGTRFNRNIERGAYQTIILHKAGGRPKYVNLCMG